MQYSCSLAWGTLERGQRAGQRLQDSRFQRLRGGRDAQKVLHGRVRRSVDRDALLQERLLAGGRVGGRWVSDRNEVGGRRQHGHFSLRRRAGRQRLLELRAELDGVCNQRLAERGVRDDNIGKMSCEVAAGELDPNLVRFADPGFGGDGVSHAQPCQAIRLGQCAHLDLPP